jgi:hypothetical protein
MSILIGKYEFDGPFNSMDELKEKPGLYAVLHFKHDQYELIHIAQAHNIRGRIELSPLTDTSAGGTVLLAACYTPECGRRARAIMVEEINNEFQDGGNTKDEHYSSATNSSMLDETEEFLSIARSK